MSGRRRIMDPFSEFGDPFAGFGFGGLGDHQSLMSGLFGGRDPFDDAFFTHPFGGMLGSTFFGSTGSTMMNANPFGASLGGHLLNGHQSGFSTGGPSVNARSSQFAGQAPQTHRSRGPIIEELDSDEEKKVEGKEEKDNPKKHGRSNSRPYVEDPDDGVEERRSKQMQCWNGLNSMTKSQPNGQAQSFTFESSSVTYGSVNGAYCTKSRTMRTGSDGLTIDETTEADSTTGQAAHRLSRGIHDKGHTVSRNLQSDGRVDTKQILHNINEDDLAGFEAAWKENAEHLPGWSEAFTVQNDCVNVRFSRSGSLGGQNVNKVNTKVDMRFNVKNAHWSSTRVRERIMKVEKNRINKDGEIVICSTKTRTQEGNIKDALAKLQAIIDAASYAPPSPSKERLKKIAKIAAIGEQERMQSKKALSRKKASQRC